MKAVREQWFRRKRSGSAYRENKYSRHQITKKTRNIMKEQNKVWVLILRLSCYINLGIHLQLSSTQSLCCVWPFETPRTTEQKASLSITNSQNLLKSMSIESVIPSNHLILFHPLLLPSIFPSIRVFSNEAVLHFRWPKYWSFSFSISPSNEYSLFRTDFFRIDWLDHLAVQGTLNSLL